MNSETSSAPRFDFISLESVFYYMVLINDGCILATVYFSSCTVYASPTEKKTIQNIMDLMVIMGILVQMETIMVSSRM